MTLARRRRTGGTVSLVVESSPSRKADMDPRHFRRRQGRIWKQQSDHNPREQRVSRQITS